MIEVSFQLKGSAISVVVLALVQYDPAALAQELKEKIDQAPQFFLNSPVLISFEKLTSAETMQSAAQHPALIDTCEPLLAICRELGLQPLGFTGVPEELLMAVRATGLAILPRTGERALKMPTETAETQTTVQVETVVEERLVQRQSKVITRPVRSGQQIYAEGADLIVLAQVSEGAEVLADGHIHVYGALRGRALAGVRGDDTARIFCQNMEAELVSIAGNFLLRDSFAVEVMKKTVQIYLDGENVCVERLQAAAN
jgi:septum site-determining protein MinC